MGGHAAPRAPETWPAWVTWAVVLLLIAVTGAIVVVLTAAGTAWGSPWWALNLIPVTIAHLLFRRHPLPIDPVH